MKQKLTVILIALFLITLYGASASKATRNEGVRTIGHGDWSLNELASWDSRSHSFFPEMAIGPDDVIHVVWQDESNLSATCIEPFYAYRLPGSNTWSHYRWLFNESKALTYLCADAYKPTIAIDSHNNIYTVYYAHTNESDHDWDQNLFETVRLANGTWLAHKPINNESWWNDYDPRLVIGPDDKQHLVFSEYGNYTDNGWDYDILYKERAYGAVNWTVAETVSTESTSDSTKPDLVVDSQNVVHVVWEDYTNYAGSCSDWDIFYKTRSPAGIWSPAEVVSTETMCDDNNAENPAITLGSDDSVHVVWKDSAPYGGNNRSHIFKILYKMKPHNGVWTTAELVSTESERDAQAPDITVGGDGTVYISWYDSTNFTEPESINDTDIVIKKKIVGGQWTDLQMISWYNNTDSSLEPTILYKNGRLHAVWEDSTDYGNPDASRDILYSTNMPGEQYTFLLDGDVRYPNGSSAGNVNVQVFKDAPYGSDSQDRIWTVNTTAGHFALPMLFPGLDIFIKDWLKFTVKDGDSNMAYVQDNISWWRHYEPQHFFINITLTDHYVYLEGMPYYTASYTPYNDTSGPSAAQIVLNYLMWNHSQTPIAPLTFPSQTYLFSQFNVGLGTRYLNADEMPDGLNKMINDSGNNWKYGYFFQRYNTTNQAAAFNQILTWMDYPVNYYNDQREVDVPAPGYANHVPVLFPYYDYNRWYVIKGIHTNQTAWPANGHAVKIYGMWLLDPAKDAYFTEEYMRYNDLVNFLLLLSQSGDPYNNQYVVVTDPPRGISVPEVTREISAGELPSTFSLAEKKAVASKGINKETEETVKQAAYNAALDVFKFDSRLSSFQNAKAGRPSVSADGYEVRFVSGQITYAVTIDTDGRLRRIGIHTDRIRTETATAE